MKVLELFAGTRSIGKAFELHGHEVFSVEWDKRFQDIDLYADILTITAADILEKFGKPDVIWASPDCTTYSVAAISKHRRKETNGNLAPVTEYAKFCDQVNAHVVNLIRELQPRFYFIENPVGGLRKMDFMQELPRYTVTYCQYGERRQKPTDIWTNHPAPDFKPPCKRGASCHDAAPRGSKAGTQALKNAMEKARIPTKLYVSKVFSCSPDFPYHIDADEVVYGGSGYCISLVNGREVFDKSKDIELPPEVEHICPDYSIYGIEDTAYGFLTRGCPRGCHFCHVEVKEGRASRKVADLNEFWNGQKNIVLCDPNILACKQWKELLQQLIDSKAWIDINQGLDIRLMTEEKAEMLKQLKVKEWHFAWDRYQDKDQILPKLKMFKDITNFNERKMIVYVLCNYDTTLEQDLERIYTLREMGYWAYVMLYDKEHIPRGHELRKLQRWVNNRFIFAKCKSFDEYKSN